MLKPESGEYSSFYKKYIDEMKDENPFNLLENQFVILQDLLSDLSNEDAEYKYDEGKWTIKEVIGHLLDTERIFAYRALCIARNEKQPLPGMEQDDYVQEGFFNEMDIKTLVEDYRIQRKSTIRLFESFHESVFTRKGTANDAEISVRALLYIILGHERHHLKILREKYLK